MASSEMPMISGADKGMSNDPFLTHNRQAPRESYRQVRTYKDFASPKSSSSVSLGSVAKPIPIFLAVSISFAFLWRVASIVPILFVLLGLARTLHAGLGNDPQDRRGDGAWLQCLACFFAVSLGTCTGLYAHEGYMRVFYGLAFGREYRNVLASSPGAAYADGGKVFFADSSTVDIARSLGYKDESIYCVAPIVDSGPEQVRSIGFWAIGKDCCGARGDFECGGAGDNSAKGGLRAPSDGFFTRENKDFMNAIKQAAAVYDLEVEDNPILLNWVSDPDSEERSAILCTVGTIILGTALFILMVVVMSVVNTLQGNSQPQKGLPQ